MQSDVVEKYCWLWVINELKNSLLELILWQESCIVHVTLQGNYNQKVLEKACHCFLFLEEFEPLISLVIHRDTQNDYRTLSHTGIHVLAGRLIIYLRAYKPTYWNYPFDSGFETSHYLTT